MTDRAKVIVLAATVFLVAWGTNISTPFLVLYADRLGLGDSATVSIFVVYVAGILSMLLVAGPLSDRFGRRPMVLPFTVLSGVGSLLLILGRDNFAILLGGRFLLGVVSGAVLGPATAWMLEFQGKGKELSAAVLMTIVTFFGFGFGALTSALFVPFIDSPLVVPFVVHALCIVAVMPFALRLPETHPADPSTRIQVQLGVPASARHAFSRVIAPSAVWVFAFPSTAFALFPVLLREAAGGNDVLVAGVAGSLTAWGGLLARPIVPRVGAARSLPLGLTVGLVGWVLAIAAMSADVWWPVLPAALLLGTASGALTSGSLALLGDLAEDESRGRLTSTFYLLAYPSMATPLLITLLAVPLGSPLVVLTMLCGVAAVAAVSVGRAVSRGLVTVQT